MSSTEWNIWKVVGLFNKLEKQNFKANVLKAITNPKMDYLPVIKKPRL